MPRNEVEEVSVGEGGPPSLSSRGSSGRLRVRADPFLICCRCFSVITALTALLCIVVNVLSAIRSFKNGSDYFNGIFRCYAVLIAVFVVVAETEWSFFTKFSKVLEYWAGRGMLQILCENNYKSDRRYMQGQIEYFEYRLVGGLILGNSTYFVELD